MSNEDELALSPEVQRLILLWEEGLLCRHCHGELAGLWEVELGICRPCVQEENAQHPLPDGPEPADTSSEPLPF